MGWTKREYITQALEEIGLANYVFDLTPEQLQSALRRLDTMIAQWNSYGIRLGYPLTNNPSDSDLDTVTMVPDFAHEAIITNLGIKLAPSYGKVVMPETKTQARSGYRALLERFAKPSEQQLPGTLPRGAGKKDTDRPYINPPSDPLLAGDDGELDFN
jgi:hypothetical protein